MNALAPIFKVKLRFDYTQAQRKVPIILLLKFRSTYTQLINAIIPTIS